ncbi:hypothetical protein [Stappia indica]|uniref:hypothetical protein n=1 Tax=Stappia indica TaxID=538381 RepID=UPI001CD70C4E|nr:hypothetical protein [Stappia indica]MCA1300225.1 hypothetical protein [Stappia indica]
MNTFATMSFSPLVDASDFQAQNLAGVTDFAGRGGDATPGSADFYTTGDRFVILLLPESCPVACS